MNKTLTVLLSAALVAGLSGCSAGRSGRRTVVRPVPRGAYLHPVPRQSDWQSPPERSVPSGRKAKTRDEGVEASMSPAKAVEPGPAPVDPSVARRAQEDVWGSGDLSSVWGTNKAPRPRHIPQEVPAPAPHGRPFHVVPPAICSGST